MSKILIVDDRPVNRELLMAVLGHQGHTFLEASDGADALEIARAERPDLTITDILMPTMDGYEFVKQLRADPAIADTPVIFCTAHYLDREARTLAEKSGVAHVLPKPFEHQEVFGMVHEALSQSSRAPGKAPAGEFDREHVELITNKLSHKADELQRANARLTALIELGRQLNIESDPAKLVQSYCRASREIVGAGHTSIWLTAGEGSASQFYTSGLDGDTAARIARAFESAPILEKIRNQVVPLRISNPGGDPARLGFSPLHPAIDSLLAAPIFSRERVYGWLFVFNKLGESAFSEHEERLAAMLTAQLAVAYEKARLYEEVVQRAAELEREIHERKQIAADLAASEQRLAAILDHSPALISLKDTSSRYLLVNRAFERMLGRPKEQILGLSDKDLFPPNIAGVMGANEASVMDTLEPAEFEETIPAVAGLNTFLSVKFPLLDDQGAPYALGAVSTDITLRKQAEQALRVKESNYRMLMEEACDGICIFNSRGECIDVNPEFCRLLGWDREELLGRMAADLVAKGDPALNLTAAAAARQAGRLLRKDGGTVMVEIGSRILRDGRAQLIVRDIGERMALEQQLRQAQKMDAVGRLAGGVAHDFNNLLTAILGYGEFALNELDPDTDLHGNVEEMMAAANRAALLTSQLLALSRRQTMQPKIVDINMAATNLGKLIRRVIGENIELVINLGRDIKPVKVDSGQIEQVILNLAINARDAMQQGGKLIIETSNVDLDEEYSRTHVNFKAGTYVIVAVSDTGVGMSQEVLAQIFEPFFTTKEAGKGTGLGLSIAYGIVAQSGGHIQAYSEPGYGSTFRIYLPVTAEIAETAPKRRRGEGMPRGTETILLVEDDQVVRNIVRTLLKGAGYVVFEAPNGADAIHIADDYGDTIHLLLTDIIMPGMNGKALAENLLSKRPGMRVIFASGYAEDVIVHYGILDPGIAFMQKPFTSRTLVSKVREVLDAPVGETRLSSAQ